MRRAIIHIGTPKTGTTSIQRYLAERRGSLAEHGFAYAAAPGKRNHIALAAYGAGEGYTGNAVRRAGGGDGDGASIGPRLARDLAAEVAGLPAGVHTMVFSSEQLSTRLGEKADVARLAALLEPHFDRFMVVVYLRRQDESAVSKYSTALRAGGETDPEIFPPPGKEGGLYDLEGIVERWKAIFGQAAMAPRLFDRAALAGGDVVRDFCELIGLGAIAPAEPEPNRNPALSAAAQEVLRRFNALCDARAGEERPRLGGYLRAERFHGRPLMPARADAEAFLARYRTSNERLRAAWFPDRATLFREDFSKYPEVDDLEGLTEAAMLDVALDLLFEVASAQRGEDAEEQFAAGETAERGGRLAEARRRFSKVLHVQRDHVGAKAGIARIDLIQGSAPVAEPEAVRPTGTDREAKRAERKAQRKQDRQAKAG